MFLNNKKATSNSTTRSAKRSNAAVSTRIVADKRWVHRNQLEVGMYVNELDKPWESTSFMFQGFVIESFETLRKVQESCEYANVQVEKMAVISTKSVNRLVGASRQMSGMQ